MQGVYEDDIFLSHVQVKTLKVALAVSFILIYADISVLIDTKRDKTFRQSQTHNIS